MKASHLILLVVFLISCAANPRNTDQKFEPEFDPNISSVDVGGFKLQMTARAALAVIRAKGYRESSGNRETLEDLVANPRIQYAILDVFEFSYGESPDDRLLRETGTFSLQFTKGRVGGITYNLNNLTSEKLKNIRERNEAPFQFVKERGTNILDGPRKGTLISWEYRPNKMAFLRVDFVERKPLFANPLLNDPGIGACDYSISVFDANPNLVRQP